MKESKDLRAPGRSWGSPKSLCWTLNSCWTLNLFGREHQKRNHFSPVCWRFWLCHAAEQRLYFFSASLCVSVLHWVLARALTLWPLLFSMQHPAEGDPCLQPNAHICCRDFYFNSLNIMPSNTLWRQKSILWIYLLFLLKKSPSTHRIPPRNKWSAAIIFFTEAAELRTRSEQYLCYLLQRELWSAYCVQLLLCFPLMQIKSLYCLFADFVFHSLITWGFIFFFFFSVCVYISVSQRNPFWSKRSDTVCSWVLWSM